MDEIRELLRNTADGAFVIDNQQRIICWNKSAEEMLGYKAEEVMGRLCYEVLGGQNERECLICRRRCLPFVASARGELVRNFDARVRRKDGQTRWVNVSIIVVPGSGDTPRGVIHLFRDVEAKKRAEAFAAEVAARARQIGLQQPMLSRQTPNSAATGPGPTLDELTPRELQVLDLLARGADTATIASELMISEATVRNHIQRILRKLGVHSRLEAVAYAREHELV
jgi:PAS domain S-box-containing protein